MTPGTAPAGILATRGQAGLGEAAETGARRERRERAGSARSAHGEGIEKEKGSREGGNS